MKQTPIGKIAHRLGWEVTEPQCPIAGYQIDSRQVGVGDLFFALKGEKTDGHHHLSEVRARGGRWAVVSSSYTGPDFGLDLLRMDSVLQCLHQWAQESLSEEKSLQVVAVTGSVGKTTTKDFIAALIGGKYKTGKAEKSHNSKLTLPLTILNRKEELEVLVLEMGMSEPHDIARLVAIAPPDFAVLTKVGLAHAAFFPGGLQEIAQHKAQIFSHPKTRLACLDHSLHDFPEIMASIRPEKCFFSLEHPQADYFLSEHEGRFLVDERGIRACQWELALKEPHLLHDFLAAVSVARALKMQWEEIEFRLNQLEVPKMRFEKLQHEGITFINDAYNANPESMKSALLHLPHPKEGGKRIAVLGVMCELGPFSFASHREIGLLAQKTIDHLLVYGEEAWPLCEAFQEVKKPAELFCDLQALACRLKELMSPEDVVLIKGSRAMQLEKIFSLLEVL